MIYILAPFNLNINTTSRNRILSFYSEMKKSGMEVTLVNPPLLGRDREVYLNGTLANHQSLDEGITDIALKQSFPEKVVSVLVRKPSYKIVNAVINLFYLIISGKDFNYPTHSLETFFWNQPLSEEDVLIASAPPATLFIAARQLAQKYGCKLVLDYRDPWTFGYKPIDSMPIVNDLKKYKSRIHETRGLEIASLICCDSESVKNLFPKKYHYKITPVLNGANLQAIALDEIINNYPVFRVVYLGTIYNDQLQDDTFFVALQSFITQHKIPAGSLEVLFVGAAKNQRLGQMISNFQLESFCRVTPRMEISQAMSIAYTAAAFLHLKYGTRSEVDTSKHLDYLALQKAIILPMTDNGNVASLIKKDNAGYVAEDVSECISIIKQLWKKHQLGKSMKTPRSAQFLYDISREAEAKKFVNLIRERCFDYFLCNN